MIGAMTTEAYYYAAIDFVAFSVSRVPKACSQSPYRVIIEKGIAGPSAMHFIFSSPWRLSAVQIGSTGLV